MKQGPRVGVWLRSSEVGKARQGINSLAGYESKMEEELQSWERRRDTTGSVCKSVILNAVLQRGGGEEGQKSGKPGRLWQSPRRGDGASGGGSEGVRA